jgi:PAS domain S-box-containing protein
VPLEEYRELFDSALDGLFISTVEGRFLDANEACAEILGYGDKADLAEIDIPAVVYTRPEDRKHVLAYIDKHGAYECQVPLNRSDGSVIDALISMAGVRDDHGRLTRLRGIIRDVTERNHADEERLGHLHFLESLDRINRVLGRHDDLETAMTAVLEELLDVFCCDRAFMLYPMDPSAPSWRVVMERTRPEWPSPGPGIGVDIPMDPATAGVQRQLLEMGRPLECRKGGELELYDESEAAFNVKSMLSTAFWPKIGKPWGIGLHQCGYSREWSVAEIRLFEEISRRLGDSLTTLLAMQELRTSQQRLSHIFSAMEEALVLNRLIRDDDGNVIDYEILEVNPAFLRASSLTREQVIGARATEIYPTSTESITKFWRQHLNSDHVAVTDTFVEQTGQWLHILTTAPVGDEFVMSFADVTELVEAKERVQGTLHDMVRTLAAVTEKRDPYTAGHQQRVCELATAIAERLGLDEERIEGVRIGASIHDIGKVSVPAELLSRPGALSSFEWHIIRTHSQAGADILSGVSSPWPLEEIVLQHHERLDGSGYPAGLKAGEILLEAQIIAVADVVEAMMSHRPYRAALGQAPALAEIMSGRGTRYDAEVVDACVDLFKSGAFDFGEHWQGHARR